MNVRDTITTPLPVDTVHAEKALPFFVLKPDTARISEAEKADTLTLYYQEQFVSADSTCLTTYHSEREFASGIEGERVSYNTRSDDVIVGVILACFFASAYVLSRSKKFLIQQLKELMAHRDRSSLFDTSTAADVRHLVVLGTQTCVLSGVCLFDYFSADIPLLTEKINPHLLLAGYVGLCVSYLIFKWMIYAFIGWVFFDKKKTSIWLESYFTIIYYAGFTLFLYALFFIYFDLSLVYMTAISLLLIISAKILILYKWIKLFFNNVYGLLLLILYFCALEILPCFIAYEGLVQINNLLLIKF
jgi:hypothetical protein